MKLICLHRLYIVLVLLIVYQIKHVRNETFEQCEGVINDSYIPNLDESCRAYIHCVGENSAKGDCPAGYYFDPDNNGCGEMSEVFCPLDEVEEEPPVDEDNQEGDEEEEEYVDENEEGETDNEEDGDEEDIEIEEVTSTVTSITVTQTTTLETQAITRIANDACPNVDNPNEIVMMPNNHSCADYYLCYHGQAIQMHCTDSLHFNTGTGKCDFPEKAHCMLDRPNAIVCHPQTTDLFPHPERCNYFYYCIKGYLTIQQCPFYYGWDIERRRCVRIEDAKCYPSTRKSS